MKNDTHAAAGSAAEFLDAFLDRAQRDTQEIAANNNIPISVGHFAEFRDMVDLVAEKVTALQAHVRSLSYEILPTMFENQNVKTIKLDDIGRVSVNVRWSATMLNREKGMEWLRDTGNEGLIIETVNASTLTAFAKVETLAGRPLPDAVFKVGTAQHISITKE